MDCLVTGSAGFIGSHLCDALEMRGHKVNGYDISHGDDMLDYSRLRGAVRDADVVFDCAGILGSEETFEHIELAVSVNVNGVLNLLHACHETMTPLVHLGLKTTWNNPYLISKRCGQDFCMMFNEYLDVPVCVVRGLNVYGPRQKWLHVKKCVPTFIMAALHNSPIEVFGSGRQVMDNVYVEDACEVMIRAWERGAWGKVLDAGTGQPMMVNEVAETIKRVCGSSSEIIHIPMRLGEPSNDAVQIADPAPTLQALDYFPQTRFVDGLQPTVQWYRGML